MRLMRATCRRHKHDEVAFAASKLYLGGLADALLAQAAMRFQDLRKGTRRRLLALGWTPCFEMCKRFHQPRLALHDVDEARPFAVERRVVNYADGRRTHRDRDADHDDNEQRKALVISHAVLPYAAGPRICFSWRAAARRISATPQRPRSALAAISLPNVITGGNPLYSGRTLA